MTHIYVLDWYTTNYYKLTGASQKQIAELSVKDFLIFEYQEKGKTKTSIGQYLGYPLEDGIVRGGSFSRLLAGREKKLFEEKKERALKQFPMFKKEFKSAFGGSKPVTARYQIFTHQLYFYFYSEQRYVFGDFVRKFQQKVGTAIFFFQVGARDMVRLSHVTDERLTADGRPLHYSYTRPLPSIEVEDIVSQGLEGRDMERLKDRSGRLKCSISYEKNVYIQELAKYPAKGQKVQVKNYEDVLVDAQVYGMNINTGEVSIKSNDGARQRLPVEDIVRSPDEKKKMARYKKSNKRRSNGQRR